MFKVCMKFGFLPIAAFLLALIPLDSGAVEALPEIPFHKAWAGSAHANAKSESFRHWDKDGEIPKACAKCHSSYGFLDFIGADQSASGVVDKPAATDSVITCVTCHNEAALTLDVVSFPSGISIANTGRNTRCMTCHQGRQSGVDVDAAVKGMPPDKASDKLKFLNVHYRAAAATLWGSMAAIGYEYNGADYHGRFEHISKLNECVECHDPHKLDVRVETCVRCHGTVTDRASLLSIRLTQTDFDGDGNKSEGIAGEIETMQDRLLKVMQAYAKKVTGKPIAYETHTYPYFFNDTNGNSIADPDEAKFKNQYKSWTPRMLKAAYNYQFALKDPGAYTHNPRYVMQLLFDSMSDLSGPAKTSMSGMIRP